MNYRLIEADANVPAGKYVGWYGGDRIQTLTTPREFFDGLHRQFAFTLDGAANGDTALLPRFSSSVAALPWAGERVFCNPPWSKIPPFVELAATADLAVLLVPARTNAKWFHRALALGAEPKFWLGKLRFGTTKHTSPVDCLLLVFWSVSRSLRPSPGVSMFATVDEGVKHE